MSNSRTPSNQQLQQPHPSNNSPSSNVDMLASRRPPPPETIPHPHHYVHPQGFPTRSPAAWPTTHQHPQNRPRMLGPDPRQAALEAGPSSRMIPPQHQEAYPMARDYSDESHRSVTSDMSMRSQERPESSYAPTSGRSHPHDDYEPARLSGHMRADMQSESTSHSRSPPRQRRTRVLMTKMQWHALMSLWEQTIFPATNEREALAQEIGLTPRQVQVWFQNQRQKRRREREIDEGNAAGAASGVMPRTAEAPPNWATSVHGAGATTAEAPWSPSSVAGASGWTVHSAPTQGETPGELPANRVRAISGTHPARGRPPLGEGPPTAAVVHQLPENLHSYPHQQRPPMHDPTQYHQHAGPSHEELGHYRHDTAARHALPPGHPAFVAHPGRFQPEGPPHGPQRFPEQQRPTTGNPYDLAGERRISSGETGSNFMTTEPREVRVLQHHRPRTEEGPGPTRSRSRSIALVSGRPYPQHHPGRAVAGRGPEVGQGQRAGLSFTTHRGPPDHYPKFSPDSLSPGSSNSLEVRLHEPGGGSYFSFMPRASSPPGMPSSGRQDSGQGGSRRSTDPVRPRSGPARHPQPRNVSTLPPSLSSLVLDRPVDPMRPAPSPLSPREQSSPTSRPVAEAAGPASRRQSGAKPDESKKQSPSLPSLARLLN